MDSDTINKNMILKSMILKKHLGLFKSIVKKYQQLNSFLKYSNKQIVDLNSVLSEPIKIKKIREIIEYFYNTRDIWAGNKIMASRERWVFMFSGDQWIGNEGQQPAENM